ncbi:MAG: YXWGXW repeat-containing protein, partial [Planctomycetota bacterium]|nr:YXWGXW repeat-containing protein [Planctomycetota bacterium]
MKTAIMIVMTLALAAGPLYGTATEQPLPPPSSEDMNAPPPTPAQEQPEVLTRGPVHEAFAEPVNLQVQAGLVAPTQSPPNIEEIPPAEKPAGKQFVWVPGYWSWDGDRNNYIWVNGCWRVAP